MQQHHLIQRVRDLCASDPNLNAAMMYGSFTYGEGDQYSDIEFLLFFEEAGCAELDQRAWLNQIAPVELFYTNEWGIKAVIFDNLVRGEFHFHTIAELDIANAWPGVIAFPTLASTLIVDKQGLLAPRLAPIIGPDPEYVTPGSIQDHVHGLINKTVFGVNVLRRGELARALEMLNITHRHLLHLVRAQENALQHWLTPSRALEQDISPAAYARFATCTAPLNAAALYTAYVALWVWGCELFAALREPFALELSPALIEKISAWLAELPMPAKHV